MDATDRKLIALLRADSRTPVATLARALKVSRGTVQNRIDRMLAQGDILGVAKVLPMAVLQQLAYQRSSPLSVSRMQASASMP